MRGKPVGSLAKKPRVHCRDLCRFPGLGVAVSSPAGDYYMDIASLLVEVDLCFSLVCLGSGVSRLR